MVAGQICRIHVFRIFYFCTFEIFETFLNFSALQSDLDCTHNRTSTSAVTPAWFYSLRAITLHSLPVPVLTVFGIDKLI